MSSTSESNARLLRRATAASVIVAAGLVLAKLFAWLATGSVTLLASLLDSAMDTLTSLTNLFAVNYSLKPPDDDHRFGHGKAEALAGLLQSLFIALSAAFLIYQGLLRVMDPQPLTQLGAGIWIVILAIIATAGLVLFQRYVVKRTRSTAIAADSLHYVTDLATNAATLLALVLARAGVDWADGAFGVGIGLFVLVSAARVGIGAIRLLMDEELPREERAQIIACATSVNGVSRIRRMRSWRSGHRAIIQLDLKMRGDLPLREVDRISAEVKQRIVQINPEADVTIQPEAEPTKAEATKAEATKTEHTSR